MKKKTRSRNEEEEEGGDEKQRKGVGLLNGEGEAMRINGGYKIHIGNLDSLESKIRQISLRISRIF